MLNPDYKTIYYSGKNRVGSDIIDAIKYSTETFYAKWERKYDETLSSYYYYGEDKEYQEKYYLFIDSPIIGTVLQVSSDRDKRNYEFDDTVFSKELKELSTEVLKMCSKKVPSKLSNAYYDYDYPYYNSHTDYYDPYSTYNYKSYKEIKREKAAKQLKDVETMRNFETL